MPADGPIDLDQEISELFNKEEMLAFFDFHFPIGESEVLSGLCKISNPKERENRSTYYSLLFLIDVPEGRTHGEIDSLMAKVDWDQFRRYLPHVENVMPLPVHQQAEGVHVSETYVYVTAPNTSPDIYVRHELYPAILRVTGFKGGELVMWSEMTELEDMARELGGSAKPLSPALRRLKGLLSQE
jgi:hypothetical protein